MTRVYFQKKMRGWYRTHHRNDLAWRKTKDPYRVFVSELMLQQTQVARVVPYYDRFVRRFPTVRKLAAAPLHEVLRFWSGLGYNRRAKYIHEAARMIVRVYVGRVPCEPALLETLPGVGPYTARAVACFSGGACEPFLETNIRRVMLHFFFPKRAKVSDAKLLTTLSRMQPRTRVREWYLMLMDYGATAMPHLPNPNRRSRHYTKQSKFEGSNRYWRGAIMRELLGVRAGIRVEVLARRIALAPHAPQFRRALSGLARDGMVRCPLPLTKSARCVIMGAR